MVSMSGSPAQGGPRDHRQQRQQKNPCLALMKTPAR
jgi:hypothetical protein